MKKALLSFLLSVILITGICTVSAQSETLGDGIYSAVFCTDSSMFSVNEAYEDRGTLTVKSGEMTLHALTGMEGKKFQNLSQIILLKN